MWQVCSLQNVTEEELECGGFGMRKVWSAMHLECEKKWNVENIFWENVANLACGGFGM